MQFDHAAGMRDSDQPVLEGPLRDLPVDDAGQEADYDRGQRERLTHGRAEEGGSGGAQGTDARSGGSAPWGCDLTGGRHAPRGPRDREPRGAPRASDAPPRAPRLRGGSPRD